MFAVTWGSMFVLYIQFYYDVLHLINNGWEFFGPLFIMFLIFGCYVGVLFWQSLNGIHYIWHIFQICKVSPDGDPVTQIRQYKEQYRPQIHRIQRDYYKIFLGNALGLVGILIIFQQNFIGPLITTGIIYGFVLWLVRKGFKQ